MSDNRLSYPLAFAVLLSTALPTDNAFAQNDSAAPDTAATDGDDIVVTAQRRSQSLMSVPLAVSAIGGDALLRQGLQQPTSLASTVPNLQVNDATGGSEPNFTLRGVGLGNEYSSNQASPVGVYADDTYLAFRSMHGSQMFDLERVEVLRGPQGTLFGRNTTGGAINFITRKPELSGTNGYFDAGYGNFNDVRIDAAAEGTLVEDRLGVRAAVSFSRHDGYVNNIYPGGPDLATGHMLRTRLSVRARPSDNLDINVRVFVNRSHQIQPGVIAVGTDPGGVNPYTGYGRGDLPFYTVESDSAYRNENRSQGFALSVKLDLTDSLSLSSLTSYDTGMSDYAQDYDSSPFSVADTSAYVADYKEINQELRLSFDHGAVKAQGGLFYGRDRVDADNKYIIFRFLADEYGLPADPNFIDGGATIAQAYRQIRISKAVFGQIEVEPVANLLLTLGGRYTRDTARYENGTSVIGDFDFTPIVQVIGTPGNPLNRRGRNSAFTGRAAISYQFPGGPLVYGSYSRGYRAGTFNGSGFLDPSQVDFVKPEKIDAYEIGAKGRFLDGALTLAGALYYYDYVNQQIQDQIGPIAILRSAGASTIKGGELEATIRFAPPVSFSGSLGYTDARYDRLTLRDEVLDGNRLPFAPKVTASGRLDITIPDVAGGDLVLSPSVTYTSSQWFTPYNAAMGNGILRQDGYALFDAVVEWKKGPWGFRLWGKNLTQKHYYAYGLNLTDYGWYYFNPGQRRIYGGAVHMAF